MTAICIAGMHRSGTSMIARALNLSGVYLGPDQDLMPAAPDNPEGFWENVHFSRINEGILSAFGGAWDLPPRIQAGWASSTRLASLRTEARALITEFEDRPLWGWKDPRSSLTLPFWLDLLPLLKIVVVVRNPLDVFRSLERRGYSSFAFSSRLTAAYFGRLLEDTAPEGRIVVHYDAFLAKPMEELDRLLALLGISAPPEMIDKAVATVRPGMRHAHSTLEGLVRLSGRSDLVDAYVSLCKEAGSDYRAWFSEEHRRAQDALKTADGSVVHGKAAIRPGLPSQGSPVDLVAPGVSELAARYELRISGLQDYAAEREQEVLAAKGYLAQKDRDIAALQQQSAEKERLLRKLHLEAAEKDQSLRRLYLEAEEKDRTLQDLSRQLTEITQSTSWRLVKFIGRVRSRVAPPGTRRDRLASQLIRGPKALGRRFLGSARRVAPLAPSHATMQAADPTLQYKIESEIPHRIVAGQGNFIWISGWCFHPDLPIRNLSFRFAAKQHPVHNVGFTRRDIWKHFGSARSLRSGFWGLVPVSPVSSPQKAQLEMVVEVPNRPQVIIDLGVVEILPLLPAQTINIDKWRRDEPLVAICLTTRNPDLKLFGRQIAAFQAQTHHNWICLVQDDDSDLALFEDMRGLIDQDERFLLGRNEDRQGQARTVQAALAQLPPSVDFVAVCDQEWVWGVDVLRDILLALRSDQFELVFQRSNLEQPPADGAAPRLGTSPISKYRSLETLLFSNEAEEPLAVFRGSLLRHLLPFPSSLGDQQHGFWLACVALAVGDILCDVPANAGSDSAARRLPSQRLIPELGMLPRWLRSRATFRHEAGTILLSLEARYHDYLTRLILFARMLDLRLANMPSAKRRSLRSIASAEQRASGLIWQALKYAVSRRPSSGNEFLALRSYLAHRLLTAYARWGRERRPRELQSPAAMMNPAQQPVAPATEIIDASVNLLRMGTAPIPLTASRREPPRVNVLLATINFQYVFGGYLAMFHLAQKMAQTGRRVRVVLVEPTDFNPEEWRRKILGYPGLEQFFDSVELSYNYDRSLSLSVNPNDAFVATSCWTAHIASRTARQLGDRKIIFLAQEYEPLFFNASSFKAISDASYLVPQFTIFSTDLLREYFQLHRIGVYARDPAYGDRHSLVFNNAINTFEVSLRSLQARQKRKLLFYARPEQHAARNMFELGILGLSEAVRLGYLDPNEWELYGIGTAGATPRVPLYGDVSLTLLPKVNLKEYRETLPSFDVGLSLMLSPHPSLVPIEMAAAGMVAVTNTCENKTAERLVAISRNLMGVDPTVDGIAEGLKLAVQRAGDYQARVEGASVQWATDWNEAFNPVFMRRLEDFLRLSSQPDEEPGPVQPEPAAGGLGVGGVP